MSPVHTDFDPGTDSKSQFYVAAYKTVPGWSAQRKKLINSINGTLVGPGDDLWDLYVKLARYKVEVGGIENETFRDFIYLMMTVKGIYNIPPLEKDMIVYDPKSSKFGTIKSVEKTHYVITVNGKEYRRMFILNGALVSLSGSKWSQDYFTQAKNKARKRNTPTMIDEIVEVGAEKLTQNRLKYLMWCIVMEAEVKTTEKKLNEILKDSLVW